MRARMHACASTFSGEVNAPINSLLNVPLNSMSLDFRANLFVAVEVRAPYGFCTTSGELFASQLLSLALANGYRLARKTLYSMSLCYVQRRFLKGKKIRDDIQRGDLCICCTLPSYVFSFKRRILFLDQYCQNAVSYSIIIK